MTATLTTYAEQRIEALGLGDSPTNCSGVVAQDHPEGVRLLDGGGFDVVCRSEADVDRELQPIADWYAESE
jgi:hypothetical protein